MIDSIVVAHVGCMHCRYSTQAMNDVLVRSPAVPVDADDDVGVEGMDAM